MDKTSKILVLVEGARTDLRLMEHLLHIYGIDNSRFKAVNAYHSALDP